MANAAERLLLGRLNSKILKTIKKLNRGQILLKNKLKVAYKKLAYYLKSSSTEIENPQLDYEDIVQDVPQPENLSAEEIMESNLKIIRNDIYANMQLIPPKRKYTMLTKIYSYCLFIKSKSAYDFTRLVVPLPCESNLRETFGNQIDLIEAQLTNIERVSEIVEMQNDCFPNEQVDVVLSVDAFSTSVLMKDEENDQKKKNKNMFVYLLIPLNFQLKPIILHLQSAPNGSANDTVIQNIKNIVEQLSKTKFRVKYCSCDGDSYYSKFFQNQFEDFIKIYQSEDRFNYEKYFENKLFIWISDPLHLFKNGRSRLMNNKIVINPEIPGNFVNCEKLNEILDLGPPLLDKTSIGKLRDIYPICIFTLNNSLRMLLNGDFDSFFYLFLYSLWNESLLNTNLSPKTRSELLQILIGILLNIYDKYTKLNLPDNVGFKKSANKEYVTMFSIEKLQRIIPTVIITMLEIEQGNPELGLARLGSHVTEQQIGQIRTWCNYDHREDKILRSTACHHFLKAHANNIFPNISKRNRLNSGGCNLLEGHYQHVFIYPIQDISRINNTRYFRYRIFIQSFDLI